MKLESAQCCVHGSSMVSICVKSQNQGSVHSCGGGGWKSKNPDNGIAHPDKNGLARMGVNRRTAAVGAFMKLGSRT